LDFLGRLLGVPVLLSASTQSGVPAIALDVWVAHELRRAGFAADEVWPRATAPRMVPREITALLDALPRKERADLAARLAKGVKDVTGAEAKILGKHYVKQVDVVMSAWHTGPQVMVSTKRMDSALGQNAANRVEESYGDAKNLRSRHPRCALGFMYCLRAAAIDEGPDKADWLIDLLGKLGEEEDAYDAVALVVPVLADPPPKGRPRGSADSDGGGDPLADAGIVPAPADAGAPAELPEDLLDRLLDQIEPVALRLDAVPDRLRPQRFFEMIIGKVLDESPVNFHADARALRRVASRAPRGGD
jgi:hypothetical protein